MRKVILLMLMLISATFSLHATDYYLKASGVTAPDALSSWNTATDGTSGADATVFTKAADVFYTQSGQNATLNIALTFSATLYVVSNSTFTYLTSTANTTGGTLTGEGNIISYRTSTAIGSAVAMLSPSTFTFAVGTDGQRPKGGTYYNLTFSQTTSSQSTAAGNLIVNGTLTIANSAAVFSMSGFLLSGNLTGSSGDGTLRVSSTSATPIPPGGNWSGTVVFSTLNQTIPAGTYNNLSVTYTSTQTIAVGGNLTVDGTLFINGTMTMIMGPYILGGTLATISNNGIITTAHTATSAPFPSGKTWGGTVRFNGTADQTVPAGTYTTLSSTNANTVKLGGATTVSGTTTVTGGVLYLNGYNLTTGALLTSAAQTFGSFGVGIKTGANTLTVGSLPAGTTTVVPLITGQSNDYSYVQLTPTNAVGWTFSLASTVSASNPEKALQRTWNLSPSASPGATTLKFSYYLGAAGITSAAAGAWNGTGNVNVNHFNTTLNAWESINGVTSYTPVLTLNNAPNASGTYYDVTVSGVTDFSPFAISQANVVLPVSLTTFNGKREEGINKLYWTTASESNNRGFTIERSADGRTYTSIGFVVTKGASGNSSSLLKYAYSDAGVTSQVYYRLVQTDFDGKTKTSAVVLLRISATSVFSIISLYPNPVVGGNMKLSVENPQSGVVYFTITDMAGRIVLTESRTLASGVSALEFDVTSLRSGSYSLKAVSSFGKATNSFLKR